MTYNEEELIKRLKDLDYDLDFYIHEVICIQNCEKCKFWIKGDDNHKDCQIWVVKYQIIRLLNIIKGENK